MGPLVRRVGLGLIWLIAASFVVGSVSSFGLSLFGHWLPNMEWAAYMGLAGVASLLLLPLSAAMVVAPTLDLCANHDHISEIALPWTYAAPGLIFGLVCVGVYLIARRRLSFPSIVVSSSVAAVAIFLTLYPKGYALLSQMQADCPPMPGG